MPNNMLDFEKPVYDLEQKLEQLKQFGQEHDIDVAHGIKQIEQQIQETKEKVYSELTPWQQVQLARHSERPYPQDYVNRIFTDFMELHGDRRYSDDKAIFGGFGKFEGEKVMVLGTRKGRNLEENVQVNFGSAHPEGYRKALRLMRLAEKANTPIICLIDTPGAYPGIGAEERHIAEAIASNLEEMFRLTVPIIVVVVGEGGSGGALGIGVGNRVLLMENAYYSVITPEGCAAILWRDGAEAPKAAEALKLTAKDLLNYGIIDDIISEPLGGAHQDPQKSAEFVKDALQKQLDDLKAMSETEISQQRYERFRKIGEFTEANE